MSRCHAKHEGSHESRDDQSLVHGIHSSWSGVFHTIVFAALIVGEVSRRGKLARSVLAM
jgi:hypothetical protein